MTLILMNVRAVNITAQQKWKNAAKMANLENAQKIAVFGSLEQKVLIPFCPADRLDKLGSQHCNDRTRMTKIAINSVFTKYFECRLSK